MDFFEGGGLKDPTELTTCFLLVYLSLYHGLICLFPSPRVGCVGELPSSVSNDVSIAGGGFPELFKTRIQIIVFFLSKINESVSSGLDMVLCVCHRSSFL